MAATLIEYNQRDEMMSITKNGESVFYGNYWDFDRDPKGLSKFLKELGLYVVLRENKTLGKIHPDELHEDYE